MEPYIEFIGTLQNSGFWLVKVYIYIYIYIYLYILNSWYAIHPGTA